jgi:hypothetical protein
VDFFPLFRRKRRSPWYWGGWGVCFSALGLAGLTASGRAHAFGYVWVAVGIAYFGMALFRLAKRRSAS